MAEKKEQDVSKIEKENSEVLDKLVKEGKLPSYRSLTRNERKKLDESGQNWLKTPISDTRNALDVRESCYDWILDSCFGDFDFGDLPNNVC